MGAIPESVADEARAKLMWGEGTGKVRAFLEDKKIQQADAEALIEEVLSERAEVFRAEGKKKIILGAALVLCPAVYYVAATAVGFLMLKLFAGLLVLAAIGIAKIFKGISMIVRPQAVKETLADRF
jgi:predicted phage tail protein